MSDRTEFSRRSLLRSSAIAAIGAGGLTGTASGLASVNVESSTTDTELEVSEDGVDTDSDFQQIPVLDVEEQVQTVPASAVPAQATGIRPGSQILVERDGQVGGCSANFVWRDASDGSLYLGTAGHCFLQDGAAAQEFAEGDGDTIEGLTVSVCTDCTFGGLTGMTLVEGEAVELGDVVYARQEEPGGGEGVGHDFGLVEIPEDAEEIVDPSVPQFGGPTGTVEGAVSATEPVVQYGAGIVNGETYLTQASRGFSLGTGPTEGSWIAGIRASPGDSGSCLSAATDALSFDGGPAAGVLTHLTGSGTAGTTVDRCIEMAEEDGLDVDLEVVLP